MKDSIAIILGVTLFGGTMLSAFFAPVLHLTVDPAYTTAVCFILSFCASLVMATEK